MSSRIDVRDFGAMGDGVTDDTSAIQAAVNYACNNGKMLIFPQANSGQSYLISNRILIPWGTYGWSIRGEAHRVQITQATDNTPFIHFDSLTNNVTINNFAGNELTNGEFEICNFAVAWKNAQGAANTHAAVIEFNDGGYADFRIESIECVNGLRCITHQYPGQTVGRALNVWGCILRHLYMGFSSSGAAIYMRSNPVEGLPNILIEHVYSNQNQAVEELINLAGATGVTIANVEQNFVNYTPACVLWAGTGNVIILNWRCEQFHWVDGQGASGLFTLNGSGAQISEYQITGIELRFNTLNLTSDKYVIQINGARVKLNGFLDTGTTVTAGHVNLLQLSSSLDSAEIGIARITSSGMRFCKPNDNFLGQVQFTGGSRAMDFYKNSITSSMSLVVNDSPSSIKQQIIGQSGWAWSLALDLDATVTAGSATAYVVNNSAQMDSGNMSVTVSSGATFGEFYTPNLKNINSSAYQVYPGDKVDVRLTTSSNFAGPSNARMTLTIASI